MIAVKQATKQPDLSTPHSEILLTHFVLCYSLLYLLSSGAQRGLEAINHPKKNKKGLRTGTEGGREPFMYNSLE